VREVEVISAWGHRNILATNERTFEITKETHLTKRGDCIVAVAADKGLQELRPAFKALLKNREATLRVDIHAAERTVQVEARGDERLTLSHPTDLVVRKSSYICPRTLAVEADLAAADFPRQHAASLRKPRQHVNIVLTVERRLRSRR
jgi:hypothetical protein